jgi:hypothetical protein
LLVYKQVAFGATNSCGSFSREDGMFERMTRLLLLGVVLIGLLALWTCAGSSDDDDDDEDVAMEGTTIYGVIEYDGAAVGDTIILGAIHDWPPTGPPDWIGEVEMSESGFPMAFESEIAIFGALYMMAYLDVDPADGVMMSLELDPMHIPVATMEIVDGERNEVNFVLEDDAWAVDDDDVDDDDIDDDVDDDADDDTGDETGITGTVTYNGDAGGDSIVFGFWSGPAAVGPPDHFDSTDISGQEFPVDYDLETAFTGDFRIVAYLDVDPGDGDSINFAIDPSNWSLSLPATAIEEGAMTTVDFELVDP